jgi:hypothetical protein
MALEAVSSDFEPQDYSKESLDIHANPSTWIMLGLLMKQNRMLAAILDPLFGTTSSDSSSYTLTDTSLPAEIEAELRYFFTTGIHQLPVEVQKDRAYIAANLDNWMTKFRLEPIQIGNLDLVTHASSGTYFLREGDDPKHVIKPIDEDIFCIHNPIFPGLPGGRLKVREDIPLYHSAERECAAFEISQQLGLSVIPTTTMAAIDSLGFSDVCDSFHAGKWNKVLHLFNLEKKGAEFVEQCGTRTTLKLCSLRDYVPHSSTLSSFLEREEHSVKDIDPNDIVAVNLMMWVTGNTDGHTANILVYPKGVKEDGSPLFGLKLIDLCLAFPEKNGYLINLLPDISEESEKLPQWAIEWIKNLPVETAISTLEKYELTAAGQAMQERIEALKLFADQDLTMEQIDTRLKYLGSQKEVALNFDEPFKLPRYNNSFASTWTSTGIQSLKTKDSSAWLRV